MAVDYLDLQARLQPSRLAARDLTTGRAWRYGQFDEDVWRVAGALLGRGVGAGDRVAVLAKNRVFQILLHLACARMGAILVPLNWRLTPAELAPILRDAEPALVVGDALLGAAGIEGVDLDGFEAEALATPAAGVEAYDQSRTSLILYTSGTSGRPKGVMLSERNNWATGQNFGVLSRVDSRSVMLSDAPMFHVIGLVGCVRPVLMHGGAVLVSDGFVAARTLARLGDEGLGVTHYFGVPTMAAMLRQEAGFDAGALRGLTGIFTGGAPLAPELIRAWGKDGIALANGYGMTEAAGTVCGMPVEIPEIERHIGACGVIPPGVEVRVVDSYGRDVPEGSEGEILLRGDNVSAGYWRRAEETKAAFTEEGWLRSGDIGRVSEDGYLFVMDRKKDMFISGGENVYPAEIEQALAGFLGVADCAVIGVPDEKWGEVGHVFVTGVGVAPEAVLAFLEGRLARYKIPKFVTVMEALPRNAAGKLVKARLREVLGG